MDASSLLALRPGRIPGWNYSRTVHDLGELKIPSGRLEASDPFVNLGDGLVVTIPPGTYPVRVTVADVSEKQDGSHLRESYLSVVLAEGTTTRVEYLVPDGATAPDDPEEFYGVGVDAGTVGFADAEAVARYMPEGDWYSDLFDNGRDDSWFALMDSPDHCIAGCANIVLPTAPDGENLVLAHSGWGDGFYPVLGSYDAEGRLLAVHIDLFVEEAEETADSIEPEPDTAPTAQPESPPSEEPRPGLWKRIFGGRG
ncbi:MAG: DUF4241 domain-containing protein [Propionicimonas sp.]